MKTERAKKRSTMSTNTELIEKARTWSRQNVQDLPWLAHDAMQALADALEGAEADGETLAVNGLTRADVAEMARMYGVARFLGVTVEDIKAFAAERAKTTNGAS